MEENKGRLKGKALSRENYLYKKTHPFKWWLRQQVKKIAKRLDPKNEDLYDFNK